MASVYRNMVMVNLTLLLSFKSVDSSIFGSRIFVSRPRKMCSSGDIITAVAVTTVMQCAAKCQLTANCMGFNVNRPNKMSTGELTCQVMKNTTAGEYNFNDDFDCYYHVNKKAIPASTPTTNPSTASTKNVETSPETEEETDSTTDYTIYTDNPGTEDTATDPTDPDPTDPDPDETDPEDPDQDGSIQSASQTCDAKNSYRWNDAVNYCQSQSDQMAVASSNGYMNFIVQTGANDNDPKCTYWVGLYSKANGGSFRWYWTDGSLYNFTNWDAGQPPVLSSLSSANYSVYGSCATGKWTATPKDNACRYIGGCRTSEGTGTDILSWDDRQAFCENIVSSTIAKLDSKSKVDSAQNIVDLFKDTDSRCTYWIGLRSKPKGNTYNWKWFDGTILDYDNWDTNQPPTGSQISSEVFYVFANCFTGKWSATADGTTLRYGMCSSDLF